jgi:hypothetical protein
MVDWSTVEMTGKGCCPATSGTLKKIAMNTLANPVDFFMLSSAMNAASEASLLSFRWRL